MSQSRPFEQESKNVPWERDTANVVTIEADAAEHPIEDDGDDAEDEQLERKLLKRELRAQAMEKLGIPSK